MRIQRPIHIMFLALLMAALACSLPTVGPQRPAPEIAVSEEAARGAEREVEEALGQAAESRSFGVSLTQQEVTSWLVLRADEYAQQAGERLPLDNLQVYLGEGVVQLYGEYSAGAVVAGALVTIAPGITPSGQIEARIASAQIGPMELNDENLESINQAVRDALAALLARLEGRYRITLLFIDDGALTVSAQVLP
jgi:hypothetical protein